LIVTPGDNLVPTPNHTYFLHLIDAAFKGGQQASAWKKRAVARAVWKQAQTTARKTLALD
jgi:hypothetical protein